MISPLATHRPTKLREERAQELPALCVGIHVTGTATYRNARKRQRAPLVHLGVSNFLRPKSNFAHYAVDPQGLVGAYASECVRPWAQGWSDYGGRKGLEKALKKRLKVPLWYHEAHGATASPLDVITKEQDSPNCRAIAIEFIQYQPPKRTQYYLTEAQYRIGYVLLADICTRHGIEMKQPFVFGHEDVDPWRRGDPVGGGWDPGAHRRVPRFCWSCFLTQGLGGSTKRCPCIIDTPRPEAWEWRGL